MRKKVKLIREEILVNTNFSRGFRKIKLLSLFLASSLLFSTSTVIAQPDSELVDVCASLEEANLHSVLGPILELGITFLIIYGFAAYGWGKFTNSDGSTEKAKWSIGAILLIYVGYLLLYQILRIDLSCILPLV